MRICLDATSLLNRKFGIGHYAENIISSIVALDDINEYTLFYQLLTRRHKRFLKISRANVSNFIRHFPLALADLSFNRMAISGDYYCGNPDVFHAISSFLPRMNRSKTVWTVHDLSFKVNPEWFEAETAEGLDERFRTNLERADHIITVSRSTKDDLLKYYDYPADHITPIHHGICAHALTPASMTPAAVTTAAALGASDRYILAVGTIEPRKNLARLVHAYTRTDVPEKLILVGGRGWKFQPVFDAIESSRRRSNITWMNYVPPEELSALYKGATFFIYPSLYEGFGLPLLEAMAHGCPSITSRTSSLPEVAGSAALYVDPYSEIDIAEKIETLSNDEDLRRRLRIKAIAQSRLFDWKTAASETIKVYQRFGIKA